MSTLSTIKIWVPKYDYDGGLDGKPPTTRFLEIEPSTGTILNVDVLTTIPADYYVKTCDMFRMQLTSQGGEVFHYCGYTPSMVLTDEHFGDYLGLDRVSHEDGTIRLKYWGLDATTTFDSLKYALENPE